LTSGVELVNALEGHIHKVKIIQSKLDMLGCMNIKDKTSESLYKDIVDEVVRKLELFNGGMDVLMCLTDEYMAILKKSNAIPSQIAETEEERAEGLRTCTACGRSNPRGVNFCISCATKLPALRAGGRRRASIALEGEWHGIKAEEAERPLNSHSPRYRNVKALI